MCLKMTAFSSFVFDFRHHFNLFSNNDCYYYFYNFILFFFCWNFDYVFSGRSNRFRFRLCPCLGALFKKSTNKIFFYEIFVEFHILWDGKKSDGFQCRWIEITLCCYFGLSPPFIRHSSYEIRGSIRSRPKETNFLKDKTKIYCCR